MTVRFSLTLLLGVAIAAIALAQPMAPPLHQSPTDKARDLVKAGKVEDALKELQAAVKGDPKMPPARVVLATIFYQAQQGQNARVSLEQAAAEDPKHPEVYLLNASFAFGEGRLTDAVLNCQTALQLAADPRWDAEQRKRFAREARLGLAATFETRRDWAATKDVLTAVLAEDPMNGQARARLAAATFGVGKPDEAYAEFRKAYADDPTVDLPELRMAYLSANGTDNAKAEEWMKRAVATHTGNPKASRAYAGWLLDAGTPDAAQPYLDVAQKLDPTGRETQALIGLMARHRKNYPLAESVFEELHKGSPNDGFSAWNLALVLAESGDKEKQRRAVELAEAEVRRNQRSGEGFVVLGWCYYKAGRLDEAEKALGAAAQAGAVSRDGAYFLARVLADRGRPEDAVKVLQSTAAAKGGYVYRADGEAVQKVLEAKLPKPAEKK